MTPKFEFPRDRPGIEKLTWFAALKDSARNWILAFSPSPKFLMRPRSRSNKAGPMMIPRPELPKLNCAGKEKQLVLNQCAIDRLPEARLPSQVRMGLVLLVVLPTFAKSPTRLTPITSPDAAV